MTPRELEEYSALRATIRQRGTARVWVAWAGLALWTAEAVAMAVLAPPPALCLAPLLLLAATFEAVFALHVGVERIGRYIQVFHEASDERASWEATAMTFGRPVGGTATDPLFLLWFAVATILNVLPALLVSPVPIELSVIGGAHFLMLTRLVVARRAAGVQRAADLARFEAIKNTRA